MLLWSVASRRTCRPPEDGSRITRSRYAPGRGTAGPCRLGGNPLGARFPNPRVEDFMEYLARLGLGIPYGVEEFKQDGATLKRLGLL